MVRQPSADPYGLILGKGTLQDRENYLEGDLLPRDKQLWFLEDATGAVVDIHQYDSSKEEWISILDKFVRSVSGISADSNGNVSQVIEFHGASPEVDGLEKQLAVNYDQEKIFWFRDGAWWQIGGVGSTEGATETHSLNPDADQVNNPDTSVSASVGDGTGNIASGDYQWAVTYVAPWGETVIGSSASDVLTVSSDNSDVDLSNIPTSDNDIVTDRNVYRTKAGGGAFYLVDNIGDNSTTTYTDTVADSSLGAEVPSNNTTEAHKGSLPEPFVSFTTDGHNHDGTNSNTIDMENNPHDINPSEGPHTGGLPWSELEGTPSSFAPESHDINPSEGPHTGGLPWSELEGIPSLATSPHDNSAHTDDFALDNHDNDSHSQNYITTALERIRYGAGQLGDITSTDHLQPPVPADVDGDAVKLYAVAREAPNDSVSATVTVKKPDGTIELDQTITLSGGSNVATETGISGTDISENSIIDFSLNDSDVEGQDFGIYLIVETEIGA